jgi:drug/metabolite transporter (DMT)-like permease
LAYYSAYFLRIKKENFINPRLVLILLFLFIILSWGIAWPINKIGLAYMSPLWYTTWRLLIGTATMMILVIGAKKLSLPKLIDLPLILNVGILQISLFILLVNIGLTYLPAGRSALLAYTTPLWIMPASIFFFGESSTPLKWIGFLLGVGGLLFLLSPWEINWQDKNTLIGASMLLLASLSWAVSMLGVRYMRWTKSPFELIPWQLLIGTLPVLSLALMKEPHTTFNWNASLTLSLLYTGAVVTGLSYWGGVVVNKALPTILLSLGFLLVPVLSLIISSYYMHEVITHSTAIAMIIILIGLICVVWRPTKGPVGT